MKKIIDGNVVLASLNLIELFDLSDVEVMGSFSCRDNSLTSLKGSPHTVRKGFNCALNDLTNLVGAPKNVEMGFQCSHNKLTSLIGAPKIIDGSFYCGFNKLKSLVGAPTFVGGTFICSSNPLLLSLDGIPITINGDFWINKSLKDKFPEKYIRSLSNIYGIIRYDPSIDEEDDDDEEAGRDEDDDD